MPNKDAPEPKVITPNTDTTIDALFDEAVEDLQSKVTSGNFFPTRAECDLCLPDTEILEVYDHLIAQLETTAIEVKLDEENKAKLLELLRESQGNLVKLPIGECGFIDNLPDGVIEATTLADVENGERAFIKGIGFGKGDTE